MNTPESAFSFGAKKHILRRDSIKYSPQDFTAFKEKALLHASQFNYCSYFNHNNVTSLPYGPFDHMLAFGAHKVLKFSGTDDFQELRAYHEIEQDYFIGYFSYDIKNQLEKLSSDNPDRMNFPQISFYIPQHILFFSPQEIILQSCEDPEILLQRILYYEGKTASDIQIKNLDASISKPAYIDTVSTLQDHILAGDIYEINYCMEFSASGVSIDPLHLYQELSVESPTPFSVFHKFEDSYLLCASPERFLKKNGTKLISQPIKGTARRGESVDEDKIIKQNLRSDEKELAENMMIVDLVRNDLARSAKTGSVRPEELFGIYTFNELHQMISTITAELNKGLHFTDALRNAFPMGSMTGAPKIKAMELIENYEKVKRGLYSGAMGYITPSGDFDFNVVIRSLLYDAKVKKLSFQVGSAITYDAIAEKEYDECLLKAKAILKILGNPQITGK